MIDLLFVYGTLMRSAAASRLGRDMRARLESSATWLGEATTAGRLFELGRYPALLASASADDIAHGEVYRLGDPAAVFHWLDPYEGIPPGQLCGLEYERIAQPVRLACGEPQIAWIYRYCAAIPHPRPIPGGRWRA